MKRFHELRHAIDNDGVDEWYAEIGRVLKSFSQEHVYDVVNWLVENMELYGASQDSEPVPARKVFTPHDLITVRALYYGVIKGSIWCGAFHYPDRDAYGKADAAMDSAEFAFLLLHPDLNSYMSFYRPLANVVEYMRKNHKQLSENNK